MESIKTIEVHGFTYQIRKMTPRAACWAFSQGSALGSGKLSRDEYAELQNECLKVCSRLQQDVPAPVILSDGRIAFKDLEENAAAILRLMMESFAFNTRPLLDEIVNMGKEATDSSAAEKSQSAK